MKLFKQACLFALVVAAVLTGCDRDGKQDVAPGAPEIDPKAIGAKWHQRSSPAELEATVKEYKALRTEQMEDFINAEADAMHQEFGQDKLTTEAYRKTRLLLHRLSVEQFGVSFNKTSGKQFDKLLHNQQVVPQLNELGILQSKTQLRPVKKQPSNGRTSEICYINYNAPTSGYTCAEPYVTFYNSSPSVIGNPNGYVNQTRCVSYWGRTKAVNATDCDFHFTFQGCSYFSEGSNWRWLIGETPATIFLLSSDTWPTQTVLTSTPGTVTRIVLLGGNRVVAAGGGQFTANHVRLQRTAQ